MLKGLRSLTQAIDKFRSLDSAATARDIHAFCVVAGWDNDDVGPSLSDLVTQLGLPTASRGTDLLNKLGPGKLDLIEEFRDPIDKRTKRLRLTRTGETLRIQLINIMER